MVKEEKRLLRKARLARLARRAGAVLVVSSPMLAPALAADDEMVTAITSGLGALKVLATAIAVAVAATGIGVLLAQYGPLIGINMTRKVASAATK